MSMSKLLESGLENQVLNGLSRDNTKVCYPQFIQSDSRDMQFIQSDSRDMQLIHNVKALQIISREPELIKTSLLAINRRINAFQVDYEGKKLGILLEPEFNKRWAEILDLQSHQPNGRRMFMTVYVHPVMGTLRVCKWLPKRNVSQQDQTFLVQSADDLRYRNDVYVIENGPNAGFYKKLFDLDIENMDIDATKLCGASCDDSGVCVNNSAISGQSDPSSDKSEPEFVEISFSESDTEYENIQAMVRKTEKVQIATSSTNKSGDASPASLDVSSISNDTLEKRK